MGERGGSERVELLVWSGTTRIVAAYRRARTRGTVAGVIVIATSLFLIGLVAQRALAIF